MHLLRRVFRVAKHYQGLSLLVVLLTWITVVTIKPGLYLAGWDNYSSYFNLPTNLFRTFFATWRFHRGMGVPSDSEVTDIFRQLFFLVLSTVFPQWSWDQTYFLVCLWIGVFGMYLLANALLKQFHVKNHVPITDVGASIAAFFYLYNLNTLGTFYFPIVTYITRFAMLPVLFATVVYLLYTKAVQRRLLLAIWIFWVISSGAYITGTVFITTLIAAGLLIVLSGHLKRGAAILFVFSLSQAFWILPFVNYTIQKSPIIKLAPNFIEANEIQLNKPASTFSLWNQATMVPNFFESTYKPLTSEEQVPFHQLAKQIKYTEFRGVVVLFPLLALIGGLLIAAQWKKVRHLIFAPVMLLLFLLLSMKEFSPVGFVYQFMDQYIPFFGVLFRFGDTKFHPFMAMSGSLCIGYLINEVARLLWRPGSLIGKALVGLSLFGITGATLLVYATYVGGLLIGPFMYVKLPDAYAQIARTLDEQKGWGKVVHLPYDEDAYWRSYSWGYIGSAFFHYMTNKPLIEKTFEPASIENAEILGTLGQLIRHTQLVSPGDRVRRAKAFATYLRNIGVEYILLDETVQAQILSRGMRYWRSANYPDAESLVETLVNSGEAEYLARESVNLLDAAKAYDSTNRIAATLVTKPTQKLALVRLHHATPQITSASEAQHFDSSVITQGIRTSLQRTDNTFASGDSATVAPFVRHDAVLRRDGNIMNLVVRNDISTNKSLVSTINEDSMKGRYVSAKLARSNGTITIVLMESSLPAINPDDALGKEFDRITIEEKDISTSYRPQAKTSQTLSDWHILPVEIMSNLRLKLGDTVLPIPYVREEAEAVVGSTFVASETVAVSILVEEEIQSINTALFEATLDPNCFGDKTEGFEYALTTRGMLRFESRNGSLCAIASLKPTASQTRYAELMLTMAGESIDLDVLDKVPSSTTKPHLLQTIRALPKPLSVRVCVSFDQGSGCANKHTMVQVTGRKQYVIPFDLMQPDGISRFQVELALKPIAAHSQVVHASDISLATFRELVKSEVQIPQEAPIVTYRTDERGALSLYFPAAITRNSFYSNPDIDGWYVSNQQCSDEGYRTFRQIEDRLLSAIVNCNNDMFHQIQFDSAGSFAWSLDYHLYSGKYPQVKILDDYSRYTDQYASLYQGYPHIQGFKQFQSPERFGMPDRKAISSALMSSRLVTTSGFFYPFPELSDTKPKRFTVSQHSENEGVLTVGPAHVSPIPDAWRSLVLSEHTSRERFSTSEISDTLQIIPSVWKFSTTQERDADYLYIFSQGYDSQWRMARSAREVIIGTGISPDKCKGSQMCFKASGSKNGTVSYYIYYWPERLAMAGWGITVGTVILILFVRRKSASL